MQGHGSIMLDVADIMRESVSFLSVAALCACFVFSSDVSLLISLELSLSLSLFIFILQLGKRFVG